MQLQLQLLVLTQAAIGQNYSGRAAEECRRVAFSVLPWGERAAARNGNVFQVQCGGDLNVAVAHCDRAGAEGRDNLS